ncbi:MAG: MFS transporter, partial [Chloroflexi bacterium]|nr:MFS transporter [Chloroflexota bacterium]
MSHHASPPLWRSTPALVLLLVQFLISVRDVPLGSFLVLYLQDQAYTPAAISQVVASAQVAGMLAALMGGWVATRIGTKSLFVLGLVVTAANGFVFQSANLWLVVLLWAIGGAGGALATIAGSSLLTQLGRHGQLGLLSGLFILSTTASGAIGHPAASALIQTYGYPVFALIGQGFVMLAAFVVWRWWVNESVETPTQPKGTLDMRMIRPWPVQLIIIMRTLATINYGMMLVLVPLRLNELTGDMNLVASYGSASLVVAAVGQYLAGHAADRWGGLWPSLISFVVVVIAGVAIFVAADQIWVLFVAGVVSIAAAWALSTMMFIWVADRVPQADHAPLFGLLYAVWSVSMVIGSLVGGWLVEIQPGLPFGVV